MRSPGGFIKWRQQELLCNNIKAHGSVWQDEWGEKGALGRTEETAPGADMTAEYLSVGDETAAVAWDLLKKSLDNDTGKRNLSCRDEASAGKELNCMR